MIDVSDAGSSTSADHLEQSIRLARVHTGWHKAQVTMTGGTGDVVVLGSTVVLHAAVTVRHVREASFRQNAASRSELSGTIVVCEGVGNT